MLDMEVLHSYNLTKAEELKAQASVALRWRDVSLPFSSYTATHTACAAIVKERPCSNR